MDCGLWCVFSERRRHVEKLWRRRLLVTADERRARRRFLRLMRGFDAEDVEVLRKAVETVGLDAKLCAPGPPMDERPEEEPQEEDSGLIPQIDRPMSMPYLCCKMWRWKDLQVDAALHRLEALPWCRFGRVTINNATVSCCNPYHYALWIRAEASSFEEETDEDGRKIERGKEKQQNDQQPQQQGNGHLINPQQPSTSRLQGWETEGPPMGRPPSLPTDSPLPIPDLDVLSVDVSQQQSPSSPHNPIAWARLERWEKRERIGDTVALTGQFAAIGLLATAVLDAQPVSADFDTKHEVSFALIRQSDPIGSANPPDVWLYNSGTRPLFLSISTSTQSSARPDHLRRLTPGYCVRVNKGEGPIDEEKQQNSKRRASRTDSSQPSTLTISVGKGWGPNYQRLYAIDTPIRYEVIFAPITPQ
ncbi:unnamed protein product, partial [Mesorhabditis belari]|uniref:Mothers against decapentaplegic homolog n=1 Tax=Mesorhabditis belari TaxID=2138241 RepID=A0AAF3F8B6_9BILA